VSFGTFTVVVVVDDEDEPDEDEPEDELVDEAVVETSGGGNSSLSVGAKTFRKVNVLPSGFSCGSRMGAASTALAEADAVELAGLMMVAPVAGACGADDPLSRNAHAIAPTMPTTRIRATAPTTSFPVVVAKKLANPDGEST